MARSAATPPDRAFGLHARLGIVVAGVILAMLVLGVGAASALRFRAPTLAARIWPPDPVSHSMLADIALQAQPRSSIGDAVNQAQRSLRRQAVNPLALRVLGLARLQQGHVDEGSRLMLASAGQSRRDLGARLWMIERAIARNDAPQALREYDLTLRAIPASRALLFPIMTNALADGEFVAPIAELFAARPPWLDDYLVFAVPSGIASANLAAVIGRTRALSSERRTYHAVGLIDQLVREGRFANAADLFAAVTGRPAPRSGAVSDFATMNAVPPFDWRTEPIDGVDVSVDANGALVIGANLARPAVPLTRLLTLAPGRYALVTKASVTGGGGARWSIACRADSRILGTLPLAASGIVQAGFTVPADPNCAAQMLAFVVEPGNADEGLTANVAAVAVRRQ